MTKAFASDIFSEVMHKFGSTEDISQHVQYRQMQPGSTESVCSMYSVSSGAFPSNFRSVHLKPEVCLTFESETQKRTSRCSTKTVYIILAAIFIVTSSVAIAIVTHEVRAIQQQSAEYEMHEHITNNTDTDSDEEMITAPAEQEQTHAPATLPSRDTQNGNSDPRTPCYKQCTAYGDPKFQSRCSAGFCVCAGPDYQRTTCLPSINGCIVQKSVGSPQVSMWGDPATLYFCKLSGKNYGGINDTLDNNTHSETHVIGIYGNHYSEATSVVFVGDAESDKAQNKPVRLVLASHFPIRWKLENLNLPLSEIVIVNDDKFSKSEVKQLNSTSITPVIRHLLQPVGYGDDRHHSNTVEMLRSLTNIFGRIYSFTGTTFADRIIVKVL